MDERSRETLCVWVTEEQERRLENNLHLLDDTAIVWKQIGRRDDTRGMVLYVIEKADLFTSPSTMRFIQRILIQLYPLGISTARDERRQRIHPGFTRKRRYSNIQ